MRVVWWKKGKVKRGDRVMTPERGKSGFSWSRAKTSRLPKPCAIM
jgi:hypothetical protein